MNKSRITAKEFERAVGRAPVEDDLERCNCPKQGKIGHWSCGWCEIHNRPMFVCGCTHIVCGSTEEDLGMAVQLCKQLVHPMVHPKKVEKMHDR